MVNVRLNILFDYYGELLTDKQQEFFKDYYFDNLTLQEIADNNGISRNAVHKTLNIINEKLEYYENILKLYEKAEKIKELTKDLDDNIKESINDLI
jgi:hypothetical protein